MYSRGVVIMVMVVVLVNMLMGGGVYSRGGDYGDGDCIG